MGAGGEGAQGGGLRRAALACESGVGVKRGAAGYENISDPARWSGPEPVSEGLALWP